MSDSYAAYEPLNTLKPVAKDVWIADGPEIRFSYLGLKLPFPTRMTVIRLKNGGLFVHSPIVPTPSLLAETDRLGPVAYLIAPNTLHYWWVPEWKARYPNAKVYAAPGLSKKARRSFAVDATLGDSPPAEWSDDIDQVLFSGMVLNEVDFFHRPSRVLVLTDLIENFEPARVKRLWLRWLVRAFGAADPDGSAPYDMRATFADRKSMRRGVERMIAWDPEIVLLAHGRAYRANGTAELRRAFRWV